ncbi:MAG: MCE family protein [Marmoricola sp.]
MNKKLAILAGALAIVLVAGFFAIKALTAPTERTFAADFADTTGVYVGNNVTYLGVPVGKVTKITAQGTTMRVQLKVTDPEIKLPKDAGAQILQSALLTDRHVELGPAYTGGPQLEPGTVIDVKHTRSPMNLNEVTTSIDDLVQALNQTAPGGSDVGDLVHNAAVAFEGNGAALHKVLASGEESLHTLNLKAPELLQLTEDLQTLAAALSERDARIRRLSHNMTTASDVFAAQSADLESTLTSLTKLSGSVNDFITNNRKLLRANLAGAATIAETVRKRQASLEETFNTMPTGAQNQAQAFDRKTRNLRVLDRDAQHPRLLPHLARHLLPDRALLQPALQRDQHRPARSLLREIRGDDPR